MESALIVTSTQKSIDFFTEMLNAASIGQLVTVQTCGEARRLLLEREFDLVIINAPLRDESGENLARFIASKGISQVILVVKSEYFEEVSAATEEDGVLTVAKPINRSLFWAALKLAKSAGARLKRMQAENTKLQQRIEDIRIIDRAKCLLISYLKLSEQEAHRFLEKQAMDMRITKRAVAEGILKMYEN
ncbi:MAG TPA: ANTAR domain-containing protein [Firmicutes bacterium]|nr:ANTAR domain-containing protein [Bacillota bacterium]